MFLVPVESSVFLLFESGDEEGVIKPAAAVLFDVVVRVVRSCWWAAGLSDPGFHMINKSWRVVLD
jgi:hypothetical protein